MDKDLKTNEIKWNDFFIIKTLEDEHWFDVEVWEIENDIMPKENLYLKGFIKWDGCSEFTIKTVHFCGAFHYKQHCELMTFIFNYAKDNMKKFDTSVAGII